MCHVPTHPPLSPQGAHRGASNVASRRNAIDASKGGKAQTKTKKQNALQEQYFTGWCEDLILPWRQKVDKKGKKKAKKEYGIFPNVADEELEDFELCKLT